MADPATVTEDLEDGEIESDGEETNETQNEEKPEEATAAAEENKTKVDNQSFYYSKSGKKKKSKSNKSEQKVKDKSKKSRKYADTVEDDFAGGIEKAIRKAMNKNDGNNIQGEAENEERRKYKKRKKYDGKEGSSKKRKKQEFSDEMDEAEMMCVRGASPVQKQSQDESYQEQDSYESDSSQDSRGHQQHRQQRHRPPQRERNKNNKNDRRRGGTHPMQDPDGVCLYYMQGKCHKGDDCVYSHDAQPPRKMELCKFYLMECCAKRDKCLYMHADFPCKYYHTGLPCIYKDECKFAHGKPLSDALKNILLKHIESAPKEILGDFPRLNRDGALKMLQNTQLKLMQQYSENTDAEVKNIPSLFDINIPNPQLNVDSSQNSSFNNERQSKVSPKVRQSRWQNDESNQNQCHSPNSNASSNVLSIKNLTGVLSPRQIYELTKIGIENLDQLSQLTVLQLNNIGISLKQISDIQLNTMSIQKLGLINNTEQQSQHHQFTSTNAPAKDLDLRVPPAALPSSNSLAIASELPGQDVDMRFQPNTQSLSINEETSNKTSKRETSNKDMIDIDQYTKDALKFASKDKENIDISNETVDTEKNNTLNEIKDVDHRVIPFSDGGSSSTNANIEENTLRSEADTDIRFLQPDPIFKNAEKRHRRSTTDDDEDNNLLIDEKWYSSDEEKGNKKKSPISSPQKSLMSPPPVVPPVIEPSSVLSKLGDLSKIDISEEVTKLLNTMKNNLHETPSQETQEPTISRDPRSRRSPPTSVDTSTETSKTTSKKTNRVSIYECIDGEPTDGRRRTDVDLRTTEFKGPSFGDTDLRQNTSGDIDLRLGLPFKPIPNYTPASEINGSINSHPPIHYKLVAIHIPRPDYTDIRNSTAKSQALTDPRLRKVFRLSVEETNSDSEKPAKVVNTGPRVDPRRKPKDQIDTTSQEQKPNSLELQTILQNSNWYKDLSSTQKIFVNQNLAPVTQMLKQYHQEKQLGKKFDKFDIASLQNNNVLCSIFTNLGVTLGENGEFSYLPKPKEALLKTPIGFNQNSNPFGMNNMSGGHGPMEGNINMINMPPMGMAGIGNMSNMNSMHGFNQPMSDPRGGPTPGLLGIAPNIPHNFNNNKFGGPHNFGNMGFNGPPNDFNFMEGDQNFQRFPNRGGLRGRGNNDRWNRGGNRGHRDRKNFNERGNWKNDRH
ncbi:unnamed protein product [Danaus chrysippus]|uniref:(African queen) hypothetical protein n=1 Tax=Danaus chrysippus TaxID=151541 RepID=A0A8J2QFL8_9NEOP|nr:unnamed protein product [Danaus chrysippus]